MYSLKQWPLKSSTPLCLSPSPQLLCFHLLNTFLYSPDQPLDLGQHKRLKVSVHCRVFNKEALEPSWYSGKSPVWASKSPQPMSSLFSACTLPSITLSEPLHPPHSPSLCSTLSQYPSWFATPLHCASMLGCLRGQERSCASPVPGASLPRSLAVKPWMKSRDKNVCGSKSIPAITVND